VTELAMESGRETKIANALSAS